MNDASSGPPAPSVSKLAGQLEYMFEDDRSLLDAPVGQLRDRLALEDRVARARHRYPNDNDAEIQARLAEFDDRIPEADVAAAVEEARRRLD
jgi:transposase